jgi:hypothetical protein
MLNYITVVFRDEINSLKIQARSIDIYVSDVASITVLVNDTDDVAELIDPSWWGKYQDRVTVKKLSEYNYTCRINGWENQQLLKLLAGAEAHTEWSMVLDAKTWFIIPLDLNILFDNHRVRSGFLPVFKEFVDSQKFCEKHFCIDMPRVIGPGGVPFMLHTATVKELVYSVPDFIEFFQTNTRYPHLVTEFHLYSGYVLSKHGTYETLYSDASIYRPINIADWEAAQFDDRFHHIQTLPNVLTASIHRRAYQYLSQDQLKQWNDFLVTKNLT